MQSQNDMLVLRIQFCTLVVCLPSAHQGSMFEISHSGTKHSFSTADAQPSFAAWYSDVVHEIEEITSGYHA